MSTNDDLGIIRSAVRDGQTGVVGIWATGALERIEHELAERERQVAFWRGTLMRAVHAAGGEIVLPPDTAVETGAVVTLEAEEGPEPGTILLSTTVTEPVR